MSTAFIILLAVVIGSVLLLALVGIAIFMLKDSKPKQSPSTAPPPTDPLTTTTPAVPTPLPAEETIRPKYINDPPEARSADSGPSFPPQPAEPSLAADTPEGNASGIRILIVDDNKDTIENVSRLLYFETDMDVIGQAYNGRQGIELAKEEKPHIVLMDINMPDMDGIVATTHIVDEAPYSQVVIMSVQSDTQYMKQALAAGAKDFQPKPFTADELVHCIRRTYRANQDVYAQLETLEKQKVESAKTASSPAIDADSGRVKLPHAPIVAVYSPKGGVGTSTVAANLAVTLQKASHKTILLDADLEFGDIMVHLNITTNRTLDRLISSDEIDSEIISQILVKHSSELQVLLAPPRPELAELFTLQMMTETLELLKLAGDLVLVDTSSQLNDRTLNVLEQADHILLVVSPELTTLKSVKLFLDLIRNLNLPPERISIVVNQADILGGVPVEQIKKVLKIESLHYLPYDAEFRRAINQGQTIEQFDQASVTVKSFNTLAEQLWQKLVETITA